MKHATQVERRGAGALFFVALLAVVLFQPCCSFAAAKDAPATSRTVRIATKAELLKFISGLEWASRGPYSSGLLPVSADFEITAPLRISSADVPVPESCTKRDDCRQGVDFTFPRVTSLVSCVRQEEAQLGASCAEISLSPGTFRLRGFLLDTHPSRYNFIPRLEVYSAGNEPCREGEFLCAQNATCSANFNEHCRGCLDLSAKECACRGPNGYIMDGSKCGFFVSGDLMVRGECKRGACVEKGSKGW